MYYFLVFLSTVILAYPFPEGLSDLGLTVIDTSSDSHLDTEPGKDLYSSSAPSENEVVADTLPPDSVSIGCTSTSDTSSTNIFDVETTQKRDVPQRYCPSPFIPMKPSAKKHQEGVDTATQKKPGDGQGLSTETADHPCARLKKPYHVSCGGPQVGVDGNLLVLNCVAGKSFEPLLSQLDQILSQQLMEQDMRPTYQNSEIFQPLLELLNFVAGLFIIR